MKSQTTINRGKFRRGYNQLVTCQCCGHRTQSQVGSGTDLCPECYDFGGEYNTWLDGGQPATALPQPKRCKSCIKQRAEAIAEDKAKAKTKKGTRHQREQAAVAKADADTFNKGKELPLWKSWTRNGEPTSYTDGQLFAAVCKSLTTIAEQPVDALNQCVEAAKGKTEQITLYRVHHATTVKGGQLVSPKGYTPRLCGLTSTAAKFEKGNHKYTARTKEKKVREPKPIVAGDWRSVACPKCNAPVGHICVRDNGKPQHNIHAARKQLAASGKESATSQVATKPVTMKQAAAGKIGMRSQVTAYIKAKAKERKSPAARVAKLTKALKTIKAIRRKVRRKR